MEFAARDRSNGWNPAHVRDLACRTDPPAAKPLVTKY
jgi:hypothetical protein